MEKIHKLQPNRTMHLRGFDDRGAGASLHSTTASSFKVSGVFRDPADFCVLMVYDRDDFFGHPRHKYLPDDDFTGMVLTYKVRYQGLMPLDSAKFPTIDWPYLDVVKADATTVRLPLFQYATFDSGTYAKASTELTVVLDGPLTGDRVVLWYQNYAFELAIDPTATVEGVATSLAGLINGVSWGDVQAIEAEAAGAVLTVRAKKPGRDGNMIRLYWTASASARFTLSGEEELSGGSSDATWAIRLDFSALGLTRIRQAWFTFAPALQDSAAYVDSEWEASFTDWTVEGDKKWLKVAGPGSVRIEETDRWCTYKGSSWRSEVGFYSQGFAMRSTIPGETVTVRYVCQHTHSIYLGTSMYVDRGRFISKLDNETGVFGLDTRLGNEPPVNGRMLIRANVPAGEHRVELTVAGSGPVYFDFLEAAVPSDVPPAPGEFKNRCPANDYGTDHSYKVSPERLIWMMDTLGFKGPLNVYVSVFWWNNRKRQGATIPVCTLTFSGDFKPAEAPYAADAVFLDIGGAVIGKTIFTGDGPTIVARHLANFVNCSSVGVWASADGPTLRLEARSATSAYRFNVRSWVEVDPARPSGSRGTGAVEQAGNLLVGDPGLWFIDTAQELTLNRGTREWLKALCREVKATGRELTLVYSMELLNPPEDPASGQVWASRFPNGEQVLTATGFGTNVTTHCTFSRPMLAYQKRVYMETADIMAEAGLPVELQVGEFLWWFFNNASPPTKEVADPNIGMAYYDDETKATFEALHGRPLAYFNFPDSDPSINGYVDAKFLADVLHNYIAELRAHVRTRYPDAVFEILLPLDVNYPRQYGRFSLGGRMNRYVNVPEQWANPATAPFDRVKMESLDFGAGTRSTDLVRESVSFPYTVLNWPKSKCRYLVAVFNGGCPWQREYQVAKDEGIPVINYWAWDHFCFFGWDTSEPEIDATADIS